MVVFVNTPSASTNTNTSPVAWAMPAFSAEPLPPFGLATTTTRASCSNSRMMASVSSVEPSSTSTTSSQRYPEARIDSTHARSTTPSL